MRGPAGGDAVICVNGGQRKQVEGTWSASLEWLVDRLAPRFPGLRFAEVRYRIKSWQRLDWCIEDAREAIDALGRATHADARLLDGRGRVGGGRGRAVGGRRARPRAVAAGAAAAHGPAREAAPGRARSPRPRVSGCSRRRAREARAPASSVRSRSAPTASTPCCRAPSTVSRSARRGARRCRCRGRRGWLRLCADEIARFAA